MKLGTSALLLAMIAASPEIRYFRYERPILNTSRQNGQTCLVLDAGTFAHSAPRLNDLRLYRDDTEVPYAIQLAAPVQAEKKSIMPLNLGQQSGQTVFDAAMSEARYSDVQLAVTGQNFIATVTVSGSQAQFGSRETKLGAYTIFDLTRQKLGRSTVLHLPESDFRYLHFRITGPLLPDSISGLSVLRLPASQPSYVTVAESSHITQKGHSSVLEFTVSAHVPVDRIAFTAGATPALFSRDVNISVVPVSPSPATDGAERPQPVTTSGNLLRVHSEQNGHRIDEERLTIDAPEVDFSTPANWKVTIDNGDDAPLTLESVSVQMLQRNLCFEAIANTRYTLFYGDPALEAPRYDYATLFTSKADSVQAAAGLEQPNSAYQSRPDERPFTEKHPALLWAALLAVIALLGGIALRSAKRTWKTLP
jgi:hypothetical protein